MHPWSAVMWAWRVLRGHSVTFAGLFALGVLGISVLGTFREFLRELGAPWYAWLLVPIIVVAMLAKKETEWMPEVEERKKWSRRLFFGSILLAVLIAVFRPAAEPTAPAAPPEKTRFHKGAP